MRLSSFDFFRKSLTFALVGAISAGLTISSLSPVAAQSGYTWAFTEGNDAKNRVRAKARLVYCVPETDDQQVSAVCEARSSTAVSYSSVILGADTGKLKNGAQVKVRFSGGGDEHEIQGEVYGVGNTNEAIAGVLIRPKHNSKV